MTRDLFVKTYNRILERDDTVEIEHNGKIYRVGEGRARIELQDDCFDVYVGNSHIIEIAYSELRKWGIY